MSRPSRPLVSLRALATWAACLSIAGACSSEDFQLAPSDAASPSSDDGSSGDGASRADTGSARADASDLDARVNADGPAERRSDSAAAGRDGGDAALPLAPGDASPDRRDAVTDGARATDASTPRDAAVPPHDAPPPTAVDASPDSAIEPARLDAMVPDATPAPQRDAAPEATCTAPRTFYRDRDGDGFGSVDDHVSACQAPSAGDAGAWVTQPGDCRDDLPSVRPDTEGPVREARYTGQGYPDPTRAGGVSFDLNCDGVEEPDPANLFETEPSCPVFLAGCSGEGYVAVTPERTGPTVNAYCGSTTIKRCVPSGLLCRSEMATAPGPFRCH